MPGRYPAATLPLPCRCHAGRHVALPCQCPVNARPPPCRYPAATMTMHGQCTAGARPVQYRRHAVKDRGRHSPPFRCHAASCRYQAGTLQMHGQYLAGTFANARPPRISATCTRPPCLHLGAALPIHGRCSVKFVAATSQVPRQYTRPAPGCY